MSVMEPSPSFAPFPAPGGIRLPAFLSRLAAAFPAMRANHAEARPARLSASGLASFSDHMLRDVGLARLDLERSAALRRIGVAGCDDRGVMRTPTR